MMNMKFLKKKNTFLEISLAIGLTLLFISVYVKHDVDMEAVPVTAIIPAYSEPIKEQSTFSQMIETLEQERIGLPIRIQIPRITVDASIVHAGLTSSGAMDIPKGPTEVAWYDLGPRPGEVGSAVAAGHFGWKDGIPAVFDHLDKMKKGDKLYVQNEYGTTTAFIVREIRTFGENDDASEVFISDDGYAHLNLVTCQGIWNKNNKSYSERLVVFTDKVIE